MNEKKEKSLGRNFFNDYIPSDYKYPEEFKVMSLKKQIDKIARYFGLDPSQALLFAETLPSLESIVNEDYLYDVEYYAVAKLSTIKDRFSGSDESRYCKANILALSILEENQKLKFFPDKINPDNFKINKRTKKFIEKIEEGQMGDIVILPCSFGLIHRGKSPNMVNSHFFPKEFGLDVFYLSCMTITHKLRYLKFESLGVDCIGTEYLYSQDEEVFEETPVIRLTQGKKHNQRNLEINSRSFYQGCAYQGAATGFSF